MEAPVLPPPPEDVVYDLRSVARRWQSDAIVVEELLRRSGIEFVDIPQPAKKGVRLSDLLRFEGQRRQEIADRAHRREEAKTRHEVAQARAQARKDQADRLVASVRAKEAEGAEHDKSREGSV